MTINRSPIMKPNDPLNIVKINPPNDNTDGKECPCGHAESAHLPAPETEEGEPIWRCQFCACTRAPAHV